jgi:hypothetical protein
MSKFLKVSQGVKEMHLYTIMILKKLHDLVNRETNKKLSQRSHTDTMSYQRNHLLARAQIGVLFN